MAGSCSGPSACSHHHLPLPFSTSLTYIKVSSLSLSPSHSRSHASVDHSLFLVSQCPQIILPGGSISCRPVAQHCHCPQLLRPQSCPCARETEPYPSTAIHQLSPSSSLSISGSLVPIWTAGFPHYPPADSLSHHTGKDTANTFLSIVLCFIQFKFLKSGPATASLEGLFQNLTDLTLGNHSSFLLPTLYSHFISL